MSGNGDCTVYVGYLDGRVSEGVLYDILVQAGRVVDLHVPKDRETDKPEGYAFAKYEFEEIANYAVKLFSGLVTLYCRTLKSAACAFFFASLLPAMTHENLGHRSLSNGTGYEYSQRIFGGTLDSINPNQSRRYDSSNSVSHSSN